MGAGQRAILQRTLDNIVGTSPWSQQIRRDVVRVAAHASNVLITGPTGTGKELIARAIHAATFGVRPGFPVFGRAAVGLL